MFCALFCLADLGTRLHNFSLLAQNVLLYLTVMQTAHRCTLWCQLTCCDYDLQGFLNDSFYLEHLALVLALHENYCWWIRWSSLHSCTLSLWEYSPETFLCQHSDWCDQWFQFHSESLGNHGRVTVLTLPKRWWTLQQHHPLYSPYLVLPLSQQTLKLNLNQKRTINKILSVTLFNVADI